MSCECVGVSAGDAVVLAAFLGRLVAGDLSCMSSTCLGRLVAGDLSCMSSTCCVSLARNVSTSACVGIPSGRPGKRPGGHHSWHW